MAGVSWPPFRSSAALDGLFASSCGFCAMSGALSVLSTAARSSAGSVVKPYTTWSECPRTNTATGVLVGRVFSSISM